MAEKYLTGMSEVSKMSGTMRSLWLYTVRNDFLVFSHLKPMTCTLLKIPFAPASTTTKPSTMKWKRSAMYAFGLL